LKCHVDIETFCELNLREIGLHRYSQHPSLEVLVVGFAIDDETPQLWVPGRYSEDDCARIREEMFPIKVWFARPAVIDEVLKDPTGVFIAHNAEFERTILNSPAGEAIAFPATPIDRWHCTMAKASSHGLRRKLEHVSADLGLEHQKDTVGKHSMDQIVKPRKPTKNNPATRWTFANAPEKYIETFEYNLTDVLCERDLDHALPDLSANEQAVYQLDQIINDHGVAADLHSVENCLTLIDEYKTRLEHRCVELCTFTPTQTAAISQWLATGVCVGKDGAIPPPRNLRAETLREYIPTMDPESIAYKVLRIRQSHAQKAPSKFEAISRSICDDGRLRGMFVYHGAQTGRWASRIVQLQNLFRKEFVEPELAIEAYEHRNLDLLRVLWEGLDPMLIFASTVRGMLIAPEGMMLLCLDYSAVEGRIVAWLADEQEMLQVYRTHGMAYEHTAATMNGWDTTDIEFLKRMKSEHPSERFAGKTAELAFGFAGGAGAYIRAAKQAGVEVDEETAERIKIEWRDARWRTREMWYALHDAAMDAVRQPGETLSTHKLAFRVEGRFLYMRLPSGRRLAYLDPEIGEGKFGKCLTYMGVNTVTRQWERVDSFGGRLTENAVQGIAACCLRRGMFNMHKAGLELIGTVHDETIAEVPWKGPHHAEIQLQCAAQLMCDQREWAAGLPLAASGFVAKRYRKDG
jgi:DNA polymerase